AAASGQLPFATSVRRTRWRHTSLAARSPFRPTPRLPLHTTKMSPHRSDDPGSPDGQVNGHSHPNGAISPHLNGHASGGRAEPRQQETGQRAEQTMRKTSSAPIQYPERPPRWSTIEKSRFLLPTDPTDVHDLVCVGFGPASLAIAVAMHDK